MHSSWGPSGLLLKLKFPFPSYPEEAGSLLQLHILRESKGCWAAGLSTHHLPVPPHSCGVSETRDSAGLRKPAGPVVGQLGWEPADPPASPPGLGTHVVQQEPTEQC